MHINPSKVVFRIKVVIRIKFFLPNLCRLLSEVCADSNVLLQHIMQAGGLAQPLLPLWTSSLLQISYRCALIYTPSFTTEPNIQSKHVRPTVVVYYMQEEGSGISSYIMCLEILRAMRQPSRCNVTSREQIGSPKRQPIEKASCSRLNSFCPTNS